MKRSHLLICFLLALWLAVSGHARAQTARIAVIGDDSLGDLIDLATAELSKSPNLTVLERADLAKLGQEQALQSAINSNALPPIQFIPADGLVILRAVKQPDGKSGVFARLVAVQPGIVLREVALPSADDPSAQVKALTGEFSSYWPKLMAIQKGKVAALSLLGLRFEVDAPDTREMERKINVLLASRLSTEPDTVVLERWRLNDAVFEKALVGEPSSPFWTGSSLVDGSMKFSDNTVAVTVHVRSPHGSDISISDSATLDQLPALIGRLANKIQTHPSAQGAWQPAAEASHFASLGKWCLDNRLYDEGAEAIESALALGNDSRTTHVLQIRAYALLAYPEEWHNTRPSQRSDSEYGSVLISPDSLPERVRAGEQALNLASAYVLANTSAPDAKSTPEDPTEVAAGVLHNALRILRAAHELDHSADHAGDITDLRHAVQDFIAQVLKLPTTTPADKHDDFLKWTIQYAAFWHETPDATLAYYHTLLADKINGAINRRDLFEPGFPILHAPYLDTDADLPGAPAWIIGSPWLITWDDRPAAEIKALWKNFVNELAASPDPVAQADALKFEFASTEARPKRDEVGQRFIAFLHQNYAALYGPRRDVFIAGFYPAIQWAARNPDPAARNDLRAMIVTQLKIHSSLPAEWVEHFPFLFYFRDKSEEAQDFIPTFEDYRTWYQAQNAPDPAMTEALDQVQNLYVASVTGGITGQPAGGFLAVHRHWPDLAGIMNMDMPGGGPTLDPRTLTIAENKIWFLSPATPISHGEAVCVDPATLQVVASYPIPDDYAQPEQSGPDDANLDVGPQWLAASMNGRVLLGSRADKTWHALDVPPSNYKPRWIGQDLYLLYEENPQFRSGGGSASTASTAVSGLIHVSLPQGNIENLISSRRVPPQTALDGKPIGYALNLWQSADQLMFALNPESPRLQIFSATAGTNDWKLASSDAMQSDIKLEPEGALIGKGFDGQGFAQLTLMKENTSQLLLANPNQPPPGSTPLWDCPEELGNHVTVGLSQLSPAMRGGDLCIYQNVNNGMGDGRHALLFYFSAGQKSPVKIPLEFDRPGMTNVGFIKMQTIILMPGFQGVQASGVGLVINHGNGLWIIPWSDIDAYRARLASSIPPSGAVTSTLGMAGSGGSPGGN